MEQVIYPVAVAAIVGLVSWGAGRMSVKTKTQEQADKTDAALKAHKEEVQKERTICQNRVYGEITEIKNAITVLMRCNLVQLKTLSGQRVNGDCHSVLKELEDYLIKK